MTDQAREMMIRFADEHLQPYKIKTKPGGDEIVPQLCPFCHGGSSGRDYHTFALSLEKGLYVCKRGSCGRHGYFDQLAKEIAGEDIKLPSGKSGASRKKKSAADSAYILPKVTPLPPSIQIYDYFQKRGISEETVDAFRIGMDEAGMIVFPFYEHGSLIYVKYRRPWKPTPDELRVKGKEWQDPGTKPILFNLDNIDPTSPVYLTEGMIDAMALYEAGLHNVVSVPSGCDNTAWIENCWDALEKIESFILFGDNDEPGRRMVANVSKRLGEYRCNVVRDYPEIPNSGGALCKDADEILVRLGGFELLDTAESAEEIPTHGLLDLSQVEDEDPANVPSIRTGIPELDASTGGLTEGGVTILSGKTGNGKSTLSGLLLLNAIEQGYSVCAYSGELRASRFKNWIDLQAAGSEWIGLKYSKVKGIQVPVVDKAVLDRIHAWYAGKFWLFDNNEEFDMDQADAIIDVFTMALRRTACQVYLLDNMMTVLSDASDEELRAQTKFINKMKKFANHYNVHVIIVCHPRKTKADQPIGTDDIAGSSNIANLADVAIVSERPNLRIIKNREGAIKKVIQCCYCPDSHRIYQADKGDLNKFSWDKTGLTPPKVRADSLPEYQVQLSDDTCAAPF